MMLVFAAITCEQKKKLLLLQTMLDEYLCKELLYPCDFYLKNVRKTKVETDILKMIITLALIAEPTRRTCAHIMPIVSLTGSTVGTRRVSAWIWR